MRKKREDADRGTRPGYGKRGGILRKRAGSTRMGMTHLEGSRRRGRTGVSCAATDMTRSRTGRSCRKEAGGRSTPTTR